MCHHPQDCTKYQSCRNKDRHVHHPRDCLFYLRDEEVNDLQKLLNDNNVEFDTEPPFGQVIAEAKKGLQALQGQAVAGKAITTSYVLIIVLLLQGKENQPAVLKCRAMLQKEVPYGVPVDEECGNAVQSGHAGLCL